MRGFLRPAAWAAVMIVTPAFAVDDSIMVTRFGNTEIVGAGLATAHLHYNADHTFTGTAGAIFIRLSLKGTWKIDGDNICLTYDSPPPTESNPSCAPATAHAIGDSWESNGHKMTLVKGIVD